MQVEDELIETTDGAFLSALEPKQLNELELKPFSLARQSVSIALGVTNRPEDAFHNSVVIAWLCTLDEAQVLRTMRDKDKALLDAFHWGESRGYSLYNYEPLLEIYSKLMKEISASTNAVVTDSEKTPEKNDGGQLPG